jgi:putative ABC transport system permease protein
MPGYFQAIGIPLRQGRDFTDADMQEGVPHRFLINETFARRYLAGENPLSKSISANMQQENPFGEIIGVVGDVKEGSVDKEPQPTIYYNQGRMPSGSMVFTLRAQTDPLTLVEPARRIIAELDPAQPVADVRTMQEIVGETYARQRFSATLLVGFSLVALLLAAVGIYGVLAYSVTERTREIGVRMALGADAVRVIAMVLASGAKVVAIGAAAGIAGALLLTGFLKSMLFGVSAYDVPTFIAVPCILAVVAALATYIPARRASRVSPVEALRAE